MEEPSNLWGEFMISGMENMIKEAITRSEEYDCINYSEQFLKAYDEPNNEDGKRVLKLLADITSYHISLENPREPFEPFLILNDRRSADPLDLNNKELDILKETYDIIDDCELRARMGDVLWVKDKSFKHGQEAIEYYLASADRLKDGQDSLWRITRALQLALMFAKSNESLNVVNSYIRNLISEISGDDPQYLTGKLMELLQMQKITATEEYFSIIERIIANSLASNDYNKARYYMDIKSKWHKIDKDILKSQETIKDIALSYEKEVESLIGDKCENYQMIVHLLEKAISTYRKIPSMQMDVNRIIKTIGQYKQKVQEGLKISSYNVDVTDMIEFVEELIKDESLIGAIIKLAYMEPIPTKKSLEERVIQTYQKSLLSFLASTDVIDKSGRRIVRMPDLNSADENERKRAIEAHMLKEVVTDHVMFANIFVSNALRVIKAEHDIQKKDLEIICDRNAFISEDRKKIFLEGLYQGFKGNFMIATHLLIPQLENSFREFARMCEDVVTTFEDDGKEQVKPLNAIFELENFVEAFDEDLLFNLRSLLTEKYGSNMRNRLAHGILAYEDMESPIAIYVFWFALRLCCMYSKGVQEYIEESFNSNNL